MPEPINAMPDRLRVLHVASGDLWAGAEAQVCTLASHLARRPDMAVAAAIMNMGELAERLRRAGVHVWAFDESRQPAWELAHRLRGIMAKWRPHVVHTHRSKENTLGGLAAASLRIPSLRTVHGDDEHPAAWYQLKKTLPRTLDALIARRVQKAVVAVSDELAAKLRARLPGARIEVIDNVVDVGALRTAATPAPQESLEPHAPALHPPTGAALRHIGIVGRLVPVKRVDLFIAAAAALDARQPGTYAFDVIGDGPLLDEARARAAAHPHLALTFHGFTPTPAPLIAGLSALAITSDHEGLPTVALEALALGVPVVTRAVGGLPALAAAGGDCTLVHGDTPDEFARALATRCANPARPAGPPPQYTAEVGAERYAQLYRRLANA